MNTHYSSAVESAHASESPRELLRSDVTVLVGVDDDAKQALESIDVSNIHDLATSPVFDVARAVYETASSGNPAGGTDQTTAVTAANRLADGDLSELAAADIERLEGVDADAATALSSALGVTTVRDLAEWPPYEGARRILGALTGVGAQTDQGVPESLVPVARKYATEQSFYTKVYLDQRVEELDMEGADYEGYDLGDIYEDVVDHGVTVDWSPQWSRIAGVLDEAEEVDEFQANLLSTAGDRRIDLASADPEVGGFRQPAVGGILQFTQEWVPQGLSLGQLLHSTTLAPGESTKVAVIDWSRRTRGERSESESQRERTEASMTQNRSMSEVQDGVTSEVQSGSSMVSSTSQTKETGATGQAGVNLGVWSTGGSVSHGSSTHQSKTTTVSNSRGRREVHAEMTQKIRNSTQQHASSSRTRRATVVRETEQEESEEVRTRVVTNHNHMHALSVHYYEVVQIFRVEVGPEDAQPVLFVPFKPIDFEENIDLVHQYRGALSAAALSPDIRDLIEGVTGYMWLEPTHTFDVGITGDPELQEMDGEWSPEGMSRWRLPTNLRITGVETGQSVPSFGIDFVIERTGRKSDVTIEYADPAGDTTDEWREAVDPPIPIDEVEGVTAELTWAEEDPEFGNYLQPGIILEGANGTKTSLQLSGKAPAGVRELRFLEGRQRSAKGELTKRLNRNQLHYSQAIWEALDSQTAAMLLGGFQIDGRPAAEYVNPTPEATHGNYVAFPLSLPEEIENAPDQTYAKLIAWWEQWTDRNYDPGLREHDLVPLPSGGVHGESILGRANGAEKLDITRFWDWQESPIPQQSPQIAPVQTGSRATDQDLSPGGFDSPIVQMQQPQSLPDPAGVGSVLNTLGQSGMFRDMSGMDAAADVAKTTSQLTGEGASHAADTAARTFEAASQARVEQTKTLAELAKSLASGGGGKTSAASAGNSSTGAMLNEASKTQSGGGGGASSSDGSSGGGTGGETPNGSSEDLRTKLMKAYASGSGSPLSAGADSDGQSPASAIATGSAPTGGAASAQPPMDSQAGREFQMARKGMGEWTWRARKLWTLVKRADTKRYVAEPDTNVDRLPIPPWIDTQQWKQEIETHYNREHSDLLSENPGTNMTREPSNVLGDFGETVDAEYFVVHDPGAPNVDNYTPSQRAGVDAPIHLWLGADSIEMNRDWHNPGNGVQIEQDDPSTTDVDAQAPCFLHTEVSHVSPDRRESGTGVHTFRQYFDLANAYLAASFRAGRFLTVTGHVEVDRALQNGHTDPVDFNVNLFYAMINASLNLGDSEGTSHGFGLDASFGITDDRLDTDNNANTINEFIPYIAGSVPKADQYGEIRQPSDGYKSYDVHLDATNGVGGQVYSEGAVHALVSQCGGGDWPDHAESPAVPSAAKPYLNQA